VTVRGPLAGRLLALVPSEADRTHLRETVRRSVEFVFHSAVYDVLHALRTAADPPIGVLLEPHDVAGRPSAGLARQIATLFPHVPVIGYCQAGAEHSHEILDLANAGVSELLFKRFDDGDAAIRAVLASARQVRAAEVVFAAIEGLTGPNTRPIVRYCLSYPTAARSVDAVARALGVHRKTLVNRCAAEGMPAPSALVGWCQLLLVGYYLGASHITVQSITQQLDFPSATALRNLLKRYTGLRPRDVRAAGGLKPVLAAFTRTLRNRPVPAAPSGCA
jgi:AraC-like DNA-binding protein